MLLSPISRHKMRTTPRGSARIRTGIDRGRTRTWNWGRTSASLLARARGTPTRLATRPGSLAKPIDRTSRTLWPPPDQTSSRDSSHTPLPHPCPSPSSPRPSARQTRPPRPIPRSSRLLPLAL
jgi:hypothetical protein